MKQFVKKIALTLLAFLVLFSTFSFTVEKLYCGNFLVGVSFFGETEKCKSETFDTPVKKSKCCKSELQNIIGQNHLQQTLVKDFVAKKQLLQMPSQAFLKCNFTGLKSKKLVAVNGFSYPNFTFNYQILFQIFLI